MIKKKLKFFLIILLLTSCSFDKKTGIWSGSEKEKRRISELEKEQKSIIEVKKIYSTENFYDKQINLTKNIIIQNSKKNSSWKMNNLNNQNFLGNIFLNGADNLFLKKKIGKNKFPISRVTKSLLSVDDNLILSDDTGTIFSLNQNGKINWKKNIYEKAYKKIGKNLAFTIHKNNIYVVDNIGFVYSINLKLGKLSWIKNYGVPIRSNIKILNDRAFFVDQDNRIVCISIKDGSKIWDVLSISSFIKIQNLLSLAISKEKNLFALNSSADLYKIDTNTGDIIWYSNTLASTLPDATDFFNSSDIVIGENQIFFSAGSSFFSYDLSSGLINWETEVDSVGTPIIVGANIFFVTYNGYFIIMEKNSGKIISSSNILEKLKRKHQQTNISGFIMGSEKIYSVTLNGYLIISSVKSGKVESFKKISDLITTYPIISNGKIYILTENSKVIAFN